MSCLTLFTKKVVQTFETQLFDPNSPANLKLKLDTLFRQQRNQFWPEFERELALRIQGIQRAVHKTIQDTCQDTVLSETLRNSITGNIEASIADSLSSIQPKFSQEFANIFEKLETTFNEGSSHYIHQVEQKLSDHEKSSVSRGLKILENFQDTLRKDFRADAVARTVQESLENSLEPIKVDLKNISSAITQTEDNLASTINNCSNRQIQSLQMQMQNGYRRESVAGSVSQFSVTPGDKEKELKIDAKKLLAEKKYNDAFIKVLSEVATHGLNVNNLLSWLLSAAKLEEALYGKGDVQKLQSNAVLSLRKDYKIIKN